MAHLWGDLGQNTRETEQYCKPFPAALPVRSLLCKTAPGLNPPPTKACGDPEAMVSREEMRQTYHACADPVPGAARAMAMRMAAEGLTRGQSSGPRLDQAAAPVA